MLSDEEIKLTIDLLKKHNNRAVVASILNLSYSGLQARIKRIRNAGYTVEVKRANTPTILSKSIDRKRRHIGFNNKSNVTKSKKIKDKKVDKGNKRTVIKNGNKEPVITGNELQLWLDYNSNPSIDNRNKLVLYYFNIIKTLVNKVYTNFFNYDDLMQEATIGLINAIERFDIYKGCQFTTYAIKRVHGTIKDYSRKEDFCPRLIRRDEKKVNKAKQELLKNLGYIPSPEIIAQYLDMDLKRCEIALKIKNIQYNKNLEKQEQNSDKQLNNNVEDAVHYLRSLDMEKAILIYLYFWKEKTLKQISDVLNLTESGLSQMMGQTIEYLKQHKFDLHRK